MNKTRELIILPKVNQAKLEKFLPAPRVNEKLEFFETKDSFSSEDLKKAGYEELSEDRFSDDSANWIDVSKREGNKKTTKKNNLFLL